MRSRVSSIAKPTIGPAKRDGRRPLKPNTMPMGNRLDGFNASRLEIRHLRYFLAVAEEEHFDRGAKRVRVAQPAISRQIRQLAATDSRVALAFPFPN